MLHYAATSRGCWQAEKAAAADAETAQQDQSIKYQQQETLLLEMRQQMAEQAEVIAQLKQQNEKLQQASPDAAAGAMALMNATAQAQQLRTDLMKDMGAISEWRQKYNEDLTVVAQEVRQKNQQLSDEAIKRRDDGRRAFDDIRVSQGLERLAPRAGRSITDGWIDD